jgi:hypothetical protein
LIGGFWQFIKFGDNVKGTILVSLFSVSLSVLWIRPEVAMAFDGKRTKPAQGEARSGALARDGNIAIREEYDAARKARSVAAYDMFLSRHPNHPLASRARTERSRLIKTQKNRPQ